MLPATGIRNMDSFVRGVVYRFIKSAHLDKFILEGKGSDERDDMIQICHLKIVELTQRFPRRAKNAAYLKQCIIRVLINYSQRDGKQQRRLVDNTLDEIAHNGSNPKIQLEAPDRTEPVESKLDLEKLMERADLTDAESLVLELKYGMGRGEGTGECSTRQTAAIMEKSKDFVQSRLVAAMIKLSVAARN